VQRGDLIRHRPTPAGRRPVVLAGLALALAAGVGGVGGVACGGDGDGDDGYGPEERSDFVEACAASGGADEEACGCFYDRLAETVPHDRFVELDEQIRDDPTAVPDEIADIAVACSARQPEPDG
jgi:hypothetical protein